MIRKYNVFIVQSERIESQCSAAKIKRSNAPPSYENYETVNTKSTKYTEMNEHIIDRGIGLPVGNKPVRGLPEYREKQ